MALTMMVSVNVPSHGHKSMVVVHPIMSEEDIMLYVLLISFICFAIVVILVVHYCLPKRVSIYTYNGKLHAYNTVWFDNGYGGGCYDDKVYAKGRNIIELYFNVTLYRLVNRLGGHFSSATKIWWYEHLLDTECKMFELLANVIKTSID